MRLFLPDPTWAPLANPQNTPLQVPWEQRRTRAAGFLAVSPPSTITKGDSVGSTPRGTRATGSPWARPWHRDRQEAKLSPTEVRVFAAVFLARWLRSAASRSRDGLLPPPPSGTRGFIHQAAPSAVSDLYSPNPYLHFNFVTACTQTQITWLSQEVLANKVARVFSPGI